MIRRGKRKPEPKKENPNRINKEITNPRVLLVTEDQKKPKDMSFTEAFKLAQELGLDLVEISQQDSRSICKILDYNKFLYQENKKKKENKVRKEETKEIKMNTTIFENDLLTKLKRAQEFLNDGHRVKFTISDRTRGRSKMDDMLSENSLYRKILTVLGDGVKEDGTHSLDNKRLTFQVITVRNKN